MSGIDGQALVVCLATTLGATLAVLLASFAVGLRTGLHRHVDVAWGLAFCAVALTGYLHSAGHGDGLRRLLMLVLVVVWGLRLSADIWWRGRGRPEDPRYARLLERVPLEHRTGYALRTVYLMQAVIVWLVSLPVQIAMYLPHPPELIGWAGTALGALGLFFESLGDHRYDHRYDKRRGNQVGDTCVWCGLFLCAATAPIGWATVVAPLLMTYLLVKGGGKAGPERQLRSGRRGGADCVAGTGGLRPLPPRPRSRPRPRPRNRAGNRARAHAAHRSER